jgi:signal transduction histidine kinase
MNLTCITPLSVGSLIIAGIALLLHYFLSRLYTRNTHFTWNLWGSLLSLCTVAYSIAAFLIYNTGQLAILRTAGRIQATSLVLAAHILFAYTFAYLGKRIRFMHQVGASLDVLFIGLIWFTDLFVTRKAAKLHYILLPESYQESVYGPLGNMLIVYLTLAAVVVIGLWIKHKKAKKLPAALIVALVVWFLLGLQDAISMVLPKLGALMPLTEYGFLGFSLAVLTIAIGNYFSLFQLAESASRAKSAFLANMSHELRTPLNHIIGFTELVASQQLGTLNETQQEYLGDSLTSSRHLLSLLNDLLDLSKIEAGKVKLELAPVELQPLLKESLNVIAEKAVAGGIEIVIRTGDLPSSINVDGRRIRQILFNLLSNAVKFTPEGGRITLTARQLADETGHPKIQISVTDTGIGIEQADRERIFQPFEQAETQAHRKHAGTGLGLSLSRELVQMHGGRIWAESAGPGHGATFRFELPLR